MTTYKILRIHRDILHADHRKRIASGLTLEEAQAHCNDPTTRKEGVWFDSFYEEETKPARSKFAITASMACGLLSKGDVLHRTKN